MITESEFDRGVREGKLQQLETGMGAAFEEFFATLRGRDCRHGTEARNTMVKSQHELHHDQVAEQSKQTISMAQLAETQERMARDDDYKFFFKSIFADMLEENPNSLADIVSLIQTGQFEIELNIAHVIASSATAHMRAGLDEFNLAQAKAAMVAAPVSPVPPVVLDE